MGVSYYADVRPELAFNRVWAISGDVVFESGELTEAIVFTNRVVKFNSPANFIPS